MEGGGFAAIAEEEGSEHSPPGSSGRGHTDEQGSAQRANLPPDPRGFEQLFTANSSRSLDAHDEFDLQAAAVVAEHMERLDGEMYLDGPGAPSAHPVGQCAEWTCRFPHFRVRGRQLVPPQDEGVAFFPAPSQPQLPADSPPAAAAAQPPPRPSSFSGLSLGLQGLSIQGQAPPGSSSPPPAPPPEDEEEVFACDGVYDEYFARDDRSSCSSRTPSRTEDREHRRRMRRLERAGFPPVSPHNFVKDAVLSELVRRAWATLVPIVEPYVRASLLAGATAASARPPSSSASTAGPETLTPPPSAPAPAPARPSLPLFPAPPPPSLPPAAVLTSPLHPQRPIPNPQRPQTQPAAPGPGPSARSQHAPPTSSRDAAPNSARSSASPSPLHSAYEAAAARRRSGHAAESPTRGHAHAAGRAATAAAGLRASASASLPIHVHHTPDVSPHRSHAPAAQRPLTAPRKSPAAGRPAGSAGGRKTLAPPQTAAAGGRPHSPNAAAAASAAAAAAGGRPVTQPAGGGRRPAAAAAQRRAAPSQQPARPGAGQSPMGRVASMPDLGHGEGADEASASASASAPHSQATSPPPPPPPPWHEPRPLDSVMEGDDPPPSPGDERAGGGAAAAAAQRLQHDSAHAQGRGVQFSNELRRQLLRSDKWRAGFGSKGLASASSAPPAASASAAASAYSSLAGAGAGPGAGAGASISPQSGGPPRRRRLGSAPSGPSYRVASAGRQPPSHGGVSPLAGHAQHSPFYAPLYASASKPGTPEGMGHRPPLRRPASSLSPSMSAHLQALDAGLLGAGGTQYSNLPRLLSPSSGGSHPPRPRGHPAPSLSFPRIRQGPAGGLVGQSPPAGPPLVASASAAAILAKAVPGTANAHPRLGDVHGFQSNPELRWGRVPPPSR
eukprot:tig00020557_g11115.t1